MASKRDEIPGILDYLKSTSPPWLVRGTRRVLFSRRGSRYASELAWWGVLGATVGLLVGLPMGLGDTFLPIARYLTLGLQTTGILVGGAIVGSLVVGMIAGAARVSTFRPFNLAASVYVETVRGIPILVFLFMVYFGLNQFLPRDWQVGRMAAAILTFSLCYGAYIGEIIRAGIEAIPTEEIEAATLEGTKLQGLVHVVLPRALRMILPALANEWISLLKDSSIVAIIALRDLTRAGFEYASERFAYFETYTMVALAYLAITLVLSRVARSLEHAFRE